MRIVLIDCVEASRNILARRLRAQGYSVEVAPDAASGAVLALTSPPEAVVADLWMPSISGVQLCRLLQSEPATMDVPVILRAVTDEPRNRFWAERAGAAGYVTKGRMGELVRALSRAICGRKVADEEDGFFTQIPEHIDIRDRIAAHLDEALFESVLAAEVRSLGTCGSFERLFDLFSQVVTQVATYRWLAISTETPHRFGLHVNPAEKEACVQEARASIKIESGTEEILVEDEDARPGEKICDPIMASINFGKLRIGTLAMSPVLPNDQDHNLVRLLAQELGGPLRMASLVEESQRLASVDTLTNLFNRRSFNAWLDEAIDKSNQSQKPLCLLLLDVDHFKQINDQYGHAAGDMVLSRLGALLKEHCSNQGMPARWGGEEFIVAISDTDLDAGRRFGSTLRKKIEAMQIRVGTTKIPVTASIGLSVLRRSDQSESFVDRADRAMYSAKSSGRNRLVSEDELPPETGEHKAISERAEKKEKPGKVLSPKSASA